MGGYCCAGSRPQVKFVEENFSACLTVSQQELVQELKEARNKTLLQSLGQTCCCSTSSIPPASGPTAPKMAPPAAGPDDAPTRPVSPDEAPSRPVRLSSLPVMQPPRKPSAAPPGTSWEGTWKCVEIEGDADPFFKEVGISWIARNAGAVINWGKNLATLQVTKIGDKTFHFDERGLIRVEFSWVIDGGWQYFTGQAGTMMVDPYFEADGITVSCNVLDGNGEYPYHTMREFIAPDVMVYTNTAPSGNEIKFYWQKVTKTVSRSQI